MSTNIVMQVAHKIVSMRNNRRVVILRGLPGSGKSTLARALTLASNSATGVRWDVSADRYFERDGVYTFDPSKIQDAHCVCWRHYWHRLEEGLCETSCIVAVDNTNVSEGEIAPYVLPSLTMGFEPLVVTVDVDVEVCLARQTHGVPEEIVRRMAEGIARDPKVFCEHMRVKP